MQQRPQTVNRSANQSVNRRALPGDRQATLIQIVQWCQENAERSIRGVTFVALDEDGEHYTIHHSGNEKEMVELIEEIFTTT